jgi:PAS domain S-box-containing protein
MDTVKVLLVDDEPRNLDALESILDSSGYSLVRAKDADAALYAILQNEFAAIVLDIKMPGTDGLELARLIKQRKRSQHVPILFLSAYSLDEKEILQAYGVGGVDFLTKPINPDILRSKVAVFANLFRTTRALASAVEALNVEAGEREKVQEELRQAKDHLESRVLQRTAELANVNQELMDNEEWLRLALAVAQVATWEWDLQSGKMRWSANPEILFGFPAGSFGSDSRMSHAAHKDDVGLLEAAFRRAMETGIYEVEYRAVRVDGSVVWIADRGRVFLDGITQRGRGRIVGVSVDLTRRKNLEEALVESDHRKNEFLATLAHELRNPLAPVRYAVKVLDVKGPETPHLKWAVELIDRQIQHMARLIDDLLDVNRISRNVLELRREKVDLASVIAVAVETSRPLIEQGHHNLVMDIPAEPIYLNADTVRLAQVFSNLLNNAAQHSRSPDAGDKIYLTAMRDGSSAVVAVKDVGVGIAPEVLPRIFEMFIQGGRLSGGGLGIGLSLARRLVEMHGGSIEAHSSGAGKGATFTVRLPILELSQSEEPETLNSVDVSEPPAVKHRILVADDNRDVVESFQIMLRILGHEVQTALDGLEAIEKAEQFRPDVIVLDVGMPMLDGYETATRIRQRPWSQDVVLIAVTGWGNEKDKLRSTAAGFNVHLVKPVDATTILDALDQMDQSRAGEAKG